MQNLIPYVQRGLQLLLPHRCPLCETPNSRYLCENCVSRFTQNHNKCPRCALPLNHEGNALCGRCLAEPPYFALCLSPLIYDASFSAALSEFKRKGKLRCGKQLTELLINEVAQPYRETKVDALVPVPMHWKSQLKRGFNQSQELTYQLSSSLNIPIYHALKKVKATENQKTLKRADRERNLRNAFQAKMKATNTKLEHLALVDDVMTTGITANMCAKILIQQGAKRVDVWTLARTPIKGVDNFYTINAD